MSNELTDVRCSCGDEYPADSYDAGFIAGSGMCQNCDAALPPKDICTCPSGDGSLVHPCPAHPAPVEQAGGDERAAFFKHLIGRHPAHETEIVRVVEHNHAAWKAWQARAALAQPSPTLPPFAEKVLAKLRRFNECAEDSDSGGVDIGRHWLDLLTQLGLLNRVQRSPALWEISQQGEDLLGLDVPEIEVPDSMIEKAWQRFERTLQQLETPGQAEQAEQAEAERPVVIARLYRSNDLTMTPFAEVQKPLPMPRSDGTLTVEPLMTVAQHERIDPEQGGVDQAGGDRWDALQSIMEWTAAENIPDDRKLCLIRNAARAALAQPSPAQAEAEQPEIVAFRYRCTNAEGEPLPGWFYSDGAGTLGLREPLMAVSQHERIVGALRAEIAEWQEAAGRGRSDVVAYIAERAKLLEGRDAALAEVERIKTISDNYYVLCVERQQQLDAALARVAELERGKVYVEARQCDECQHGGINDSATGVAACHECDWTGPEPEEDRCPGCQRENCMAAACPQCGARYVLVASEEIAAPVAQAQQLHDLDKQCRDDVARALGLRPSQERGFAWSYLLASIKSCVKASEDAAQAQHSVPEISGIGRDAEHPRAVVLYLRNEPSDEDMRAIQNFLRAMAAPAQHSVPKAWFDVQAERRRQVEAQALRQEVAALRARADVVPEVFGLERYRVEKTGQGFWPYCVRAGDGTRELFVGHLKQCQRVATELATAFEDGKFIAAPGSSAQHSVPEGWKLVPIEPLFNMMSDKDHDTRITAERQLLSILADAPGNLVPQAWLDVQAERRRQITAEGWTPEHDDLYCAAELPRAAAAYILNGANDEAPAIWPFSAKWWKPRDARANYVRAGALILAEIERLDRATAPGKEGM